MGRRGGEAAPVFPIDAVPDPYLGILWTGERPLPLIGTPLSHLTGQPFWRESATSPKMAARAGFSVAQTAERGGGIDLPHSPHSDRGSPEHRGEDTELQSSSEQSQMKESLLDWIKGTMRKEFQDLVKEHKLGQPRSKDTRKSGRRPPRSPTPDPKRSKDDLSARSRSGDFPSESEESDSASEGEEGELSEEDEGAAALQQNRLFPTDLYERMLPKVLRALVISPKPSEGVAQDPEYPRGSDESLPRKDSGRKGMPLPDIFHDAMRAEWENPAKPKSTHPIFSKLYTLTQGASKEIKLPLVDDPVNSLSSTSILPMDADGLPKDQCDRRIEQALRRDFEASANSLRAAASASLFARASYVWASKLITPEVDIDKEFKDEIKKVALASAFAADATFDAFQMASRAMAYSVAARRNTWLRCWEADPSAQTKLAAVPFLGFNLFGDALERYLVEDKDKKKVLPSKKKEHRPRKRFRSFRDNRGNQKSGYSRFPRQRWQNKPREDARSQPYFKAGQSGRGGKKSA